MKIKFIKEYVAVDPVPTSGIIHRYRVGETKEITPYTAQWLIDNGFAKEVKESGWKPRLRERYYYLSPNGGVYNNQWENDSLDNGRLKLGFVFKTEEATERYRDYLKAVETVRHDEGFMKISRKINYDTYGYAISHSDWNKSLIAEKVESINHAGQFYFDTSEHAEASLEAHGSEWETILNYDWSKGEDEEDEN